MDQSDLETAYEALAQKIDSVGDEKTELYLAKLALLLAKEVGDLPRVLDCIEGAGKSLD
jgi:hypothetical protein